MYTFYKFNGILYHKQNWEEEFIYIIHKPIDFSIDFSYRLKTSSVA